MQPSKQPPKATPSKRGKQQITYGKRRRLLNTLAENLPDSSSNALLSAMFSPPSHQTDYSQQPPAVPPRPAPRSQKEATMMVEPSDEQIMTVAEFTGCDPATARRYLRVKKDVEPASDAILNQEDITQAEQGLTWDENAWSTDRDGNAGGDGSGSNLNALGAPTAPPSPRVPSPRPNLAPGSQQEADADMQAAMAASLSDGTGGSYNFGGQQETGTVGNDGAETNAGGKFGPATKSEYDMTQWSIVPHSASTSEVVPDVLDVEKRRCVAGEPRFVKPLASVDGDYLPSLITICHAIVGAREALLMRHDVRSMYGEDAEWWKGHAITLPRIVQTDSGRPVDEEGEDYNALVAEVQRLMAFLDQSERSYASAAPLAQNNCLKSNGLSNTHTKTLLELFMNQWGIAASRSKHDECLMFDSTLAKKNSDGMVAEDETITLVDLDTGATKDNRGELYAMLDNLIWGDGMYDNPPFSLESPAEVLVMRLRQRDTKEEALNAEVHPQIWLDRYLTKNEEALAPVRRQMAQNRLRISKLSEAEKKLKTWRHPTKNEDIDTSVLMKHTYGVFSGQNKLDADDSGMPNGVAKDDSTPPHYAEIAEKLERTMRSINEKLEKLAAEKEKARKAIMELSRKPLVELDGKMEHRYILRGVATKPSITYALLPKAEQDEDEEMETYGDDEEADGEQEGMQWWRIEYRINSTGTGATVDKTKTPWYDVCRAVELEHKSAMLVYASDKMNDIANLNPDLPANLQQFVDRDNELFRAELEESRTCAAPPAYHFENAMHETDIRTSIERRGSNSSTEVQFDPAPPTPPDYEQEGFENHAGFGLPPAKQGYINGANEDDAPVVEIRLDDEGSIEPQLESQGTEMEMVEKAHQPLIPGYGAGGDTAMGGMESQDAGVGGDAQHVENMKPE